MAVIYLFDAAKRHKRTIRSVQEIIHKEGEYTAIAQISGKEKPEYGDFFGFQCVDGRFRMFLITIMDKADETGIRTITGTDAALAELNGKILTGMSLSSTTAQSAAQTALNGTGWQLGTATGDGEVETEDAYYNTVWEALKTIAAAGKVRIVPYYEFADGMIVGRKVDVLSKEPVFRGMIHTRKKGARNIYITKEGSPKGRVYGLGKIIGTGNPPEQVTFKEAVWSKANGDPADKPAGQDWVDIPGAISDDGYVFADNRETNPKKLLEKAYADLEKKQKPKAGGTANITDMEWKPGYSHRVVRMWDLAVVRTEDGEIAEATVINIERYYVKKHLTKITIGEENETDIPRLEEQIANLNSVSGITARRVGGVGNAAAQNKQLILNAEELIQLNAKRIELNAEEINLRATKAEVVELEEETAVQFSEVYIDLNAAKAQIELKASQTVVDNLGNQVDNMSATLTIQAEQISSKVEKNGVISAINQTAEEVKIAAERINLEGYVTASELAAEVAEINKFFTGVAQAEMLDADTLTCQTAQITNVSLINYACKWTEMTMGEVASARMLIANVGAVGSALDLNHSHAVTVNDTTGQVTLGEVSETGGNFNIADTQFFKDAVAAAQGGGDITLTAAGWISNGENIVTASTKSQTKTLAVKLPEFKVSGGTTWNSQNKTTVYFSTDSVTGSLKSKEVDASSIYTKGTSAGYQTAKDNTVLKYANFSIRNTAPNYFFAEVTMIAEVGGEQVATRYISTSQQINVGQ